jgi:Skp family chaperone for outer membrane proteins
MRRIQSCIGIALLGVTALSPAVFAQAAPAPTAAPVAAPTLSAPSIAIVDVQRVLGESAAGKSIQAQLETEGRKIRDQITRLEDELKNGENELKRQRSVMAPDAFNEQAQALQRRQAEAQRIVQDRRDAFTKGQNDAVNVVGDNIRDIVQQLAAERHIGMVLRKEVVMSIADKNMDITDDVIHLLNTKLPSVTVTVPAGGVAQATNAPAEKPAPAKGSKK